ncbi:hypothetical protein E4U58_001548 [Claviceps cyperi]|nr:hypothetical protein E4U58_001548 [Claviceps cyperi]
MADRTTAPGPSAAQGPSAAHWSQDNDLTTSMKDMIPKATQITPLKGSENFEEWEISMKMHIRILGLTGHFEGTIPWSESTDQKHALLTHLVWQTLSTRVQKNILRAGWDYKGHATDLMMLIRNDCGFQADVAVVELLGDDRARPSLLRNPPASTEKMYPKAQQPQRQLGSRNRYE